MTEERRRSTDPWLQMLFEQNTDQHKQNTQALAAIQTSIQSLSVRDENHSGRINVLEKWREDEVDPILMTYRESSAQIKGGIKLWHLLVAVVGGAGAVAVGALKFMVWVAH